MKVMNCISKVHKKFSNFINNKIVKKQIVFAVFALLIQLIYILIRKDLSFEAIKMVAPVIAAGAAAASSGGAAAGGTAAGGTAAGGGAAAASGTSTAATSASTSSTAVQTAGNASSKAVQAGGNISKQTADINTANANKSVSKTANSQNLKAVF